MIIPDYIKVPLSAIVPILMNLAQANEIVVFITGIASFIYVVYKILESHEKRKYYKQQKQKNNENF